MSVKAIQVGWGIALQNGKNVYPELWYNYTGADPTPTQLQSIADAATTEWQNADTRGLLAPELALKACYAQLVTTVVPGGRYPNGRLTPVSTRYFSATADVVGTLVQNASPPQTCILINCPTTQPGRSHRGRWYGPPPCTSVVAPDGTLTPAHVTDWAEKLQDMLTAVLSGWASVVAPVVVSRKLETLSVLSNYICRSVVATQRRRATRT
jgi:hypothetical protein